MLAEKKEGKEKEKKVKKDEKGMAGAKKFLPPLPPSVPTFPSAAEERVMASRLTELISRGAKGFEVLFLCLTDLGIGLLPSEGHHF